MAGGGRGFKGEFRRPPGVGRQPDCLLLAKPTSVGTAVAGARRKSGAGYRGRRPRRKRRQSGCGGDSFRRNDASSEPRRR